MSIFFAVIAALLLCLMVSAKDSDSRAHFTYAFLAAVAGVLVTYALR